MELLADTYSSNIKELYSNILSYDLFIFDLDGTIIDSEKLHYKAWIKAIELFFNNEKEIILTMAEHHKYCHSLKKNSYKDFLYYKFGIGIEEYEGLYKIKQNMYNELIHHNIELVYRIESFFNFLKENKKRIIIVTNTSQKSINILAQKFEIIGYAEKIYTKELFFNKKPNPECYLRVLLDYPGTKKIGFEDSLIGMHALYQVSDIKPILIYNDDYYYTKEILEKYPNIIKCIDYDIEFLEKSLNEKATGKVKGEKIINNYDSDTDNDKFIESILKNNIFEMMKNLNCIKEIIKNISILIQNLDKSSHIFISGLGKSGYVCKKCVSTWQSLSIPCSYIDLPNLPHGDFGQFKNGDLLILVSNSGNTEEIIYILKYLQEMNLKNIKKVMTISIVANKNSLMEKYSHITFIMDNIKEADLINMAPSTSNILFMTLLDGIAINLKKNITKEEFQLCHPGGNLGKL